MTSKRPRAARTCSAVDRIARESREPRHHPAPEDPHRGVLGDRRHRRVHPGPGEQDRVGDADGPGHLPDVRPQSVVQRYAPVRGREYAIENEVNAPQYWAGQPRGLRAAGPRRRRGDPRRRPEGQGGRLRASAACAYGMGVADRLLRAGRPDAGHRRLPGVLPPAGRHPGAADPGGEATRQLAGRWHNETNARNLALPRGDRDSCSTTGAVDVRQVILRALRRGAGAAGLPAGRARRPACRCRRGGRPVLEGRRRGRRRPGRRDGQGGHPAGRRRASARCCWLPLAYNPNNRPARGPLRPARPGRHPTRGRPDDGGPGGGGPGRDRHPAARPGGRQAARGRVRPGWIDPFAGALVGVEHAGDGAGGTGQTTGRWVPRWARPAATQ